MSHPQPNEYAQEAQARWGNTPAYKQSQARVATFTDKDWQDIKHQTKTNMEALVALMLRGDDPSSADVQAEIKKHHAGIERFYDCSPAMYRALANMYLSDQRFANSYRQYHNNLPEFLVKGMLVFCDNSEK